MTRDEWNQIASLVASSGADRSPTVPELRINVQSAPGEGDLRSTALQLATGAPGLANSVADSGSSQRGQVQRETRPVEATMQQAPVRLEVEAIARGVASSEALSRERQNENQRPQGSSTQSGNSGRGDGGGSITTEVLKTAGLVTGVGPIVTGLLKLFGGGEDKPAELPLVKHQMPSAVAVDAGLMQNRGLSGISYAADGQVRSDVAAATTRTVSSSATAPQIQIQVNAMDSRSFLDHSDEIAQAVRAAMLRSHSLNDVVSEL